ncbi:hypothetical protein GGR56DRAFT_624307 [Xylariaceae sp. FL0804]|nr:hypothetical protein GGR56DRAFT_624307 [Xylariaceae sp. FL0804]
MNGPPPPPPPHGENPRTTNGSANSNLPPGKYDIFIIPPHSSGSGFLYLPSLKPNVNSFAAGFASALILVVACQSIAPALRTWWNSFQGMGNMGMLLLVIAVGVGAWALGRTQIEGGSGPGAGWQGTQGYGPNTGGHDGGPAPNASSGPAPDSSGPPPPPPHNSPPPQPGPPPSTPGADRPKSSWQQRPQGEPPKGAWEKAREETRRKEEERKAREAEQRKKDEIAKRLRELREKEARERAKREQEARERQDTEAREKAQKEKEQREREESEKAQKEKERAQREKEIKERRAQEARERNLRERLERERATRERLEKEAKEREAQRLKEAAAARAKETETARKSTYAFSSMGERTNPWPSGKPASQPSSPVKPSPAPPSAQRPPPPTAKTYNGMDEEAYSYRPYDQPKAHSRRRSGETVFTESSYAPSMSTSRTTPPPSMRGPYTTKDPDKIVIKAVYGFLNQFSKTPAQQLISGVGHVTDGLILRITTEGLFIDDDVRGVPQREWDVKAWTLKLMEVWCPSNTSSTTAQGPQKSSTSKFRLSGRGQSKTLLGDDADTFLMDLLHSCRDECRLGAHGDAESSAGEWRHRGLHALRANIRDQEGKRYLFVLGEEEGWKVAVGLQRLRKGALVRQLGIQPMPVPEARTTLETLGW